MENKFEKDVFLAIDPGSVKCGLAVLEYSGAIVLLDSALRIEFNAAINEISNSFPVNRIVVGNGTTSATLISEIKENTKLPVLPVDERGTTLRARRLWAEKEWSRGIYQYVPLIIKTIFEPSSLDSYAAWAIGLQFLENCDSFDVE